MNSRTRTSRNRRASRLCFSLLPAGAILGATAMPASALLFTSQVATSTAEENAATGALTQTQTSTSAPADAKVQLGDGTNAFGSAAFAEAFGTFRGHTPTYWVNVIADNTVSPSDLGDGRADVQVHYTAIKQHGDHSFTLNVSGGAMRLVDPGGGARHELFAEASLEVQITHGTSLLRHVVADAFLHGNGGTFQTETFDLRASGFDFDPGTALVLESAGNDVGAVHTELPKMTIPVDLDGITDGTALDINIDLFATASAPGGEAEALAFLRDPAHADDADPLAGGSSISITTDATGPVAAVPEPSGLALFAPALFALVFLRRGKA